PGERDQTVAYYFTVVDVDVDRAIAAYRDLLTLDSNSYVAMNNLALALFSKRQYASVDSLTTRGLPLGCSNCYQILIQSKVYQGQDSAAWRIDSAYIRAFPRTPNGLGNAFWIATDQLDYPTAERLVGDIHKTFGGSPYVMETSTSALAGV